jgi:iron complex transport system substrate-binding protein
VVDPISLSVRGAFGRFAASAAVLCAVLSCGPVACNDARGASRDETGVPAASVAASLSSSGLRWAKTLEWSRQGDAYLLTISEPWKGARIPLRYTLRPAGPREDDKAPRPRASGGAAKSAAEIRMPARRVACLAAVHTGFLNALGAADRIVAVDAKNHVHDAAVRAGVEAGRIVEVGSGAQLNVERLLAAKPDLVLANAVGASENEAMNRLRRAGVPVLITAEWMENHPLARAEWLRLFGLLVGRAARADSLFGAIEASYQRIAQEAQRREAKPTILLGGPFRDQWFVSGGRSFMARLLGDAGGHYLWSADTTAGGVPFSFEAVLVRARGADVWLHPGDWRSLAAGTGQDARFAGFSAFQRGDVYNNDARLRPDGANDYWESGVARPDRVLADLVSIFHGNEDSLYYYRRLPP